MPTTPDPKYKLRITPKRDEVNNQNYVAFEAYHFGLEEWKEIFIRPTEADLIAMASTPVLDSEGKEQLDENGNVITEVSPFYYIP